MIDKRARYKMEEGYCRSDYSFYTSLPDTIDGWDSFYFLQGLRDEWVVTGSYVRKGKWSSENVYVLDNLKGVQIEANLYGFRRITTEHEKALKEQGEYEKFFTALTALDAPAGIRRWHAEVLGMFENEFEEVLYYGE